MELQSEKSTWVAKMSQIWFAFHRTRTDISSQKGLLFLQYMYMPLRLLAHTLLAASKLV
jgi:hypothetical protein